MLQQPDIIFFMVDQLSARWLEAARRGACPVPNIDRLAAMGTTFTRAYTSNPVCCPARATLATGLSSRGHGVTENGYTLDPALPTHMQALQKSGYRTGAFGKVHLHPHQCGLRPDYTPFGYDVTHITEDPRGGEWLDWVRTKHPASFDGALATIWANHLPEFEAYGPQKENLKARITKARATHTWASDRFPYAGPNAYPLPFPEEVSQTNWITAHSIDFIRSVPREQPLHAHISYVQPHVPFCAPEGYFDMVDMKAVPAPCHAEWMNDPNAPAYFSRNTPPPIEAKRAQWYRHCYFADIAHLDRQLGMILDTLEETKRLDNACIILLADHGDLLGDHGFWGKEERHYDACIRIPLIIAGPHLQQGQECHQLVQLEDICPTVLACAKATLPLMPTSDAYQKKPASDIAQIPGKSLLPLCQGEQPTWRESIHVESYCSIWGDDPNDWPRTVITETHRYTWFPDGGEQCFDLQHDPDEQVNLARDASCLLMRETLRERLLRHMALQDYPRTRRNLFALGAH